MAVVTAAKPYPKSAQLARGERRYRRTVASAKQWLAIMAEKRGPCRVCGTTWSDQIQFHHLVSRGDFGDDVEDNIVPVHGSCHDRVTRRVPSACRALLASLTDAERAYMLEHGGTDYAERRYGVTESL